MKIRGTTAIAVFAIGCLLSMSATAAESTVKIPPGASVHISGQTAIISGGGGGGAGATGHYSCSCSGAEGTCEYVQSPTSLSCHKGTTSTCKGTCELITTQTGVVGPAALSPPNTSAPKGGAGMQAPAAGSKK